MSRLRPDFASGKLSDTSITAIQTVIDSGQFATLPVVAAPDVVELVLDPFAIYGAQERVIITVHAAGSTAVTVTRGAYGSTARIHNANGVQEDWCASITDEDFYHSTLYNLGSDDHPQYQTGLRHTAQGNHAYPLIIDDILGFGIHLKSQQHGNWIPVTSGAQTQMTYDTSLVAVGEGAFSRTFIPATPGFFLVTSVLGISSVGTAIPTETNPITFKSFIIVNQGVVASGTTASATSVAALTQGLSSVVTGTFQLASSDVLTISYIAIYSGTGTVAGNGYDAACVTIDKLAN